MPIYMKYEGITGAVTAEGYKEWIELQSSQMGVCRNVRNPSGAGQNREAAVASMGEVVITKTQCCATNPLFRAALDGTGKKVEIVFVKTEGNKVEVFEKWVLENTLVSNFNQSAHGGPSNDRPMESLSLNFAKITLSTTTMDKDNKTGKPQHTSWDLALLKAS